MSLALRHLFFLMLLFPNRLLKLRRLKNVTVHLRCTLLHHISIVCRSREDQLWNLPKVYGRWRLRTWETDKPALDGLIVQVKGTATGLMSTSTIAVVAPTDAPLLHQPASHWH